MCITVIFNGKYCDSIDDLRKAIFPKKLSINEGYGRLDGNNCLCPVAVEKTAQSVDCEARNDHYGDPMEWHFVPLKEINDGTWNAYCEKQRLWHNEKFGMNYPAIITKSKN